MIRIRKPADPPAVLVDRGAEACRGLCEQYDAAPADHQNGARTFEFDPKIYGHPSVRAALAEAQHGKCCFCERKVEGDVEHFRPKSRSQQARGDPPLRPGYYWLAYEWSNLFFACGPCNQRYKRDLFPLAAPARRARSHHDDLAAEDPLFLDPANDEPAEHIAFRSEVAYAVNGSPRGQATIDLLALNRPDLQESRRERLGPLRALKVTCNALDKLARELTAASRPIPSQILDLRDRCRAELSAAVRDDAEFAALARCALRISE